MPLDPQVQSIIGEPPPSGSQPDPVELPTPAEFRALLHAQTQMLGPGPEVARVESRVIPGPDGGIPIRVYWPGRDGPLPVLVWFHGGGFVIGDLDFADVTCRSLAVGAGAIVVSVDYRLAPEHPYPAAVEDAIAAVSWVARNTEEIDGDADRLAVGGDSAGGNLATIAAVEAKLRGWPGLRFQLLVYPVTDATRSFPSYIENADGYGLTAATMAWFLEQYVGDADLTDPRVSPLRARPEDLVDLPETLIITAEYDVLRDEGEAYGRMLEAAGVVVTSSRYDGQIHGFVGMATLLDGGKAALEEAATALRRALA